MQTVFDQMQVTLSLPSTECFAKLAVCTVVSCKARRGCCSLPANNKASKKVLQAQRPATMHEQAAAPPPTTYQRHCKATLQIMHDEGVAPYQPIITCEEVGAAHLPTTMGFFQPGTRRGTLSTTMGSLKTVPFRMLRMVPLGLLHIFLSLNSFTRASSGVMVAHLMPTPLA